MIDLHGWRRDTERFDYAYPTPSCGHCGQILYFGYCLRPEVRAWIKNGQIPLCWLCRVFSMDWHTNSIAPSDSVFALMDRMLQVEWCDTCQSISATNLDLHYKQWHDPNRKRMKDWER